MKTFIAVAALAAASIMLTACQSLAGVSDALVPQLKPIEARIATVKSCGDLVRDAMSTGDGGLQLSADQAVRLIQGCEQRDKDSSVTIDPQAGRRALHSAIARPLPLPGT